MEHRSDAETSSARTRRPPRWGVWLVVAGIAIAGVAVALSRVARDQSTREQVTGRGGVAAITLTDFDGKRFSLAEYRGKPLVVNFWASWCPSCAAEMPDFERVHQAVAGEVAFLGINQTDSRDAAKDLARDTGVTYRLAADPRGEAFQAFGAPGMPTTVFIDASGDVAEVVVGQLTRDALMDRIRRNFGDSDAA